MKAVILAAGVGSRLRPLTDATPKGLIPVGGRPMISYAMDAFYRSGITEVIVVTGHLSDQVEEFVDGSELPCRAIYNPRYDTANNYYSLLVAEEALAGEAFVKVDSDLVFRPSVLARVLSAEGDLCLAADTGVALGDEEMKIQLDGQGRVIGVSKRLDPKACVGESIGMERISAALSPVLFDELRALDAEDFTDAYYEDAYHRLAQRGGTDIRPVDVTGLPWAEIDNADDLAHAETLFRE
ncbi:MAG: phosphocholine cytidylyltransferase family protein [bacterium]